MPPPREEDPCPTCQNQYGLFRYKDVSIVDTSGTTVRFRIAGQGSTVYQIAWELPDLCTQYSLTPRPGAQGEATIGEPWLDHNNVPYRADPKHPITLGTWACVPVEVAVTRAEVAVAPADREGEEHTVPLAAFGGTLPRWGSVHALEGVGRVQVVRRFVHGQTANGFDVRFELERDTDMHRMAEGLRIGVRTTLWVTPHALAREQVEG